MSKEENVVNWTMEPTTGQLKREFFSFSSMLMITNTLMTATYKNSDGSTSYCNVLYDEKSGKLSLSAEKPTGTAVVRLFRGSALIMSNIDYFSCRACTSCKLHKYYRKKYALHVASA